MGKPRTVRIPDEFHEAARLVAAFGPKESAASVTAMSAGSRRGMAAGVGAATGLTEDKSEAIVRFVESLYGRFLSWDLPAHEFAAAILRAIEAVPNTGVANRTALEDWLRRIGALTGPIPTRAKGQDVQSDHAKIWCHGRILTDIRPVFAVDDVDTMEGAVIVHTLKIHFRSHVDEGEVFVAMNRLDLMELKELVDRALRKDETSRKALIADVEVLEDRDE